MKKQILDSAFLRDFFLIGISAHIKEYKLCGILNRAIHLDLAKINDFRLQISEQNVMRFSQFVYEDEVSQMLYRVVANKSQKGFLVPEQYFFDYYLVLQGSRAKTLVNDLLKSINQADHILTSSLVPFDELKSKKNLISLFYESAFE